MNDLLLKEIVKNLEKKEFSCREITEHYLNVIKQKDKKINAFISVFEHSALGEAGKADRRIKAKQRKSLFDGVPIAIKDNIMVEGEQTTAGSKILKNYKAVYDASVIKRIKDLGFVILGKTNLDEFAMGSSTENSAYGPTKNPFDLSRVPGGSSGGSAVAVAAGEIPVALGSDTGGSIRQPAAFCGVVGLQPSYGRVSRYGLIALASSLDQIGPIAKTVDEAEIIFKIISGKDEKDSTTVHWPYEDKGIKAEELKIGVPKEYFVKGLDKKIRDRIESLLNKMADKGFDIKEISLPHTEYALAVYYIIMPAEASANLARFDGIRYGFHKAGKDIWSQYENTRGQGFGLETRRRIILGTYVLSAGYYDAYYKKASRIRKLIRQDFDKAFEKVDVLITPTTPTLPFKIGQNIKDPLSMYLSDVLTVPVNLAGLPALAVPIGKADNLPVSLQLIANRFEEEKIFALGRMVEDFRLRLSENPILV